MNILLSNISLVYPAGSELYTKDLAKYLSSKGHSVTVFSTALGPIAEEINRIKNVSVTNNLEEIKDKKFDVLHIHHNVNAYLLREYFPKTPAIMVIHGVLPEYEQPPRMDLGISQYIAVSEEVRDHLMKEYDIPKSKIEVIYNWVNKKKFAKKSEINPAPKSLLVISNHLSSEQEEIYKSVCREKGIEYLHIGLPDNPVFNVEDYINKADIIVTIGRGAIESIMCGRNVIISDIYGIDGMLTPTLYSESMKNNLSGRRFGKKLTKEIFEEELGKYSVSNAKEMQKIVMHNHNREQNIQKIISLYIKIKNDNVRVDKNFNKTILEIKTLARLNGMREVYIYNLEERLSKASIDLDSLKNQNREINDKLSAYRDSKLVKLGEKYRDLKSKIIKH